MRKVTEQASKAFREGRSFRSGNTEVELTEYSTRFKLHGHIIAFMDDDSGVLNTTLAGYPTVTTKERLNGLLTTLGIDGRYHTINHQPMLNGNIVGDSDWHKWRL